jgi:Uma2 family endonuclease
MVCGEIPAEIRGKEMAMVHQLSPKDHDRFVTWDEYAKRRWQEGFEYELVDGKLYVSPRHELPENRVEKWIGDKLERYAEQHPEIINFVYGKACVFVPKRPGITCIGPDQTAFHDFPYHLPVDEVQWQHLNPVLVAEVVTIGDPNRNLVRNVELYFQAPTIKEYWLIDTREDPERPTFRMHRRYGKRWRLFDLSYGDIYSTKLLPGFDLILDPRR